MARRDRLGWVLVVVSLVVVGGCTGHGDRGQPPPAPASQPASECGDAVLRQPLPVWARAGFSPPDQRAIYVQGARGDIVGVLFGWPLTSPPPRGRQNKILWVARVSDGAEPLRITARLENSGLAVTRQVEGGAGPSTIDLPAAGCWRFELTWSGHSDQLYIPYQPR
jgi:hypothetical protein